MRKKISLVLVLMLVVSLFFAIGCKKKIDTPDPIELEVEFGTVDATLKVGATVQLSFTVTSESTTTAAYESSDASVVSVSNEGLVTALAKGSATIKVTVTDTEGNKKEKEYKFTIEAIKYTLTYSLDGGALADGKASEEVEDGATVNLPVPTKEGYVFLGWTQGEETEYVTAVTVNANVTVKAHWEVELKQHTISYELDGGTLSTLTVTVDDGKDYVLKTPSKAGYAFLGYTLTKDSTDYTRKITNVTADITVYAHWVELINVKYELDDGTYTGATQVKKGSSLALTQASKDDHIFLGWSLSAGSTEYVTEVNDIAAEVTLYANWQSITEALENVSEGGTLQLGPGTYTKLTITKSITILGNNAYQNPNIGPRQAETIFTGDIDIQASDVTIKGIELFGNGRIKASKVNVQNITCENIYVYGCTLNVGNLSNNSSFYFVGGKVDGVEYVIKNVTITNSRIDNDSSISNDRPMILYGYDIENLTITGNVFNGRCVNYNDGIKIDNTKDVCVFGIRGNVIISHNEFSNYQQYVIWFRRFAGGNYYINNNTFNNIGFTAASHATANFITYTGAATDKVHVEYNYNRINNSMMMLRLDANAALTNDNVTFNARYNAISECSGTYWIKNGTTVKINANNNYWSGAADSSKIQSATYDDSYTEITDVPVIGDADVSANTYTVTYDLDGGYWFIDPEATRICGHEYDFGIAEKEGYTFVNWVDANGQIYEFIPSYICKNLSLKATWAKTVLPTEFEVINLPDDGIARFTNFQLEWEFIPADTYNQKLEFASSDENVFTVNAAGVISAVGEGTATLSVKVLADETLSKTYEIKVYTPARVIIESNGSSVLEEGKDVQLEAAVAGEAKGNVVFTSSDASVATVDATGKVTALKAGSAVITATIEGTEISTSLTINVKASSELDEVTKYVMSIMNANAFTSYAADYDDAGTAYYYQINRGAASFLFEELNINNTYARTYEDTEHNLRDGVKYITIHDTGNMSKTATAAANAAYFQTDETSIHFVTGNDGVYAGVGLTQRAAHAGDGADRYYALEKTNVKVTEGEPVITMINGNFAINGQETECRPYTDHEGTVKTETNYETKDICYSGIRCVAGEDGYYYLGKTYFNETYQQIANFGGNAASIGIESAVNAGTDYYWTMQRTAKLVAYLLDQFDLTIDDVKMHNFFSGKNCAQLMKNNYRYGLDYKQDGWDKEETLWGEFLELVEIESKMYEYAKNYDFQFESYDTTLLDNAGHVVGNKEVQTEVKYKVTITNKTTFEETSFEGSVLIPSIYELGK